METPKEGPLDRHRRIVEASRDTDFVLNRRMLRDLGVDRHQAARQVRSCRWLTVGEQTISVRDAPLTMDAQHWRAVWEVGERIALVDGASALIAAGLTGWDEDLVHVSVLHSHDLRPVAGVVAHKVIRRVPDEAITAGLPRTRPAVAAIRAAHWAYSDRAALTIMAMAVQQRIVTGDQLLAAQQVVRGRTRRALVRQAVRDIALGAQSLGELDFTALCRARGLPEPSRQVVRQRPNGRAYLDVAFEEHGFVVEIDGAGHVVGLAQTDDALRSNDLVIGGERVLRINVLGLRIWAEEFMDQVERALRSDWARANVERYHAARRR